MLVKEMDIPTRMKNVLIRKHITDSDSITDELINGLMNEQGIGKVSVEALREAMKALSKPSEIAPEITFTKEMSNALLDVLPLSGLARFMLTKIIDIIEHDNGGVRRNSIDTATECVDIYINKKYVFIEQKFATSIFFGYRKQFIEYNELQRALDELMELRLICYNINDAGVRFAFSRYQYLHCKANYMRIEIEKLGNLINRIIIPYIPAINYKQKPVESLTLGNIATIRTKVKGSKPVKAEDLLKSEVAEQEIKKEKKRDTEYSVFISQYLSTEVGCNVTCTIYKKHPVSNGYIMVEVGLAIYDSASDQVDIISKDTLSAGEIKSKIKEVI